MSDRLEVSESALLLIDWQERLFPAMPEGVRESALNAAMNLRWLAGELGLPVLVSEQYPRGLGSTLPQLAGSPTIEKISFSAMREPAFADALGALSPRRDVLLSGMETHICVAQTARDLSAEGYRVWLIADACLSRRKLDWRLGLERAVADGCRVVSAEAALFELVGRAGTPLFKELSKRIR